MAGLYTLEDLVSPANKFYQHFNFFFQQIKEPLNWHLVHLSSAHSHSAAWFFFHTWTNQSSISIPL